jgi:hypothetical protein
MMLREVCQYMIRNTLFERKNFASAHKKPEFQVFPIPLLSELTLAVQLKKIAWSFTEPEETAERETCINPRAAISDRAARNRLLLRLPLL